MKLSEISGVVKVEIVRNSDFNSLGFVTHKETKQLVFLDDERFLPELISNHNISCVITIQELMNKLPDYLGIAVADNARKAFYEFHNFLAKKTDFFWKDFPSEISSDASIHPTAYVAENNVRIGKGVLIEPGALIMEGSEIEDDVVIRGGATIGAVGFEFKRFGKDIISVVHAGGALLRKGVEVQCNANIDRSVFGGYTEIGEYSKIDTLVHVAHNVKIGVRCLIAAHTVINGSTVIGDDVWIGPGSVLSNGLTVGDRAYISIGSVVTKDVDTEQKVSGNFAIPHAKFIEYIKKISNGK